jgi:hypothetical protein
VGAHAVDRHVAGTGDTDLAAELLGVLDAAFAARSTAQWLDALGARGVVPLIVKGTALAYSLYDEPEHRPRADTDLLIAAGELDAAREAFRELGHAEQPSSGDMRQTMFRRVDAAGADHVYDVHWAIANTPVFAGVLQIAELRERSVPLPRLAPHARTIGDVDALLYACIHRVAHHHDDERLIWLADIHFLLQRMADEQLARFWQLAKEREVVAVCIRSVELAREWFGGERGSARDFLDDAAIARAERSREYLEQRPRRLRILRAELAAEPGWRARARRLRQLAFPPAAYMQARFRTRSRLALPWLYLLRGLKGVARLFRRIT